MIYDLFTHKFKYHSINELLTRAYEFLIDIKKVTYRGVYRIVIYYLLCRIIEIYCSYV
jgi:hypothetical protein